MNISAIFKFMEAGAYVPIKPENWRGRVFHHRRELQEGYLLFLSNFDSLETSSVRFRSEGNSVIELDLFNGELYRFPSRIEENHLTVEFDLPPANSRLFYISREKSNYPLKKSCDKEKLSLLPTPEPEIMINGSNAIILDYCDIEVKGRKLDDIYFYQAADTIFKEYLGEIYGFNYNPWSVAVQFRTTILDKNIDLKDSEGYIAHFRFSLNENFKPARLRAVIENPDLFSVRINEVPVAPVEDQWWLDRDFGVYDIASNCREGDNVLTLIVKPMNVLAELEPVYLTGNFSVYPVEKGWELYPAQNPALGSWKDMGMPFYQESVSYIKHIQINPQDLEHLMVELPSWNGTLAEIIVNEKSAGLIAWHPHHLDIIDLVKNGNNKIEVKVFGSLKNLLGPHHNHPTKGFVTPWSFFYAPTNQPPGMEYDLNDYGLFSDFQISGY